MREYSSWIEHKGKRVVLQDYSGLVGEEVITALRANEKFTDDYGQTSGLLVLLDMTDAVIDRESLKAFKVSARKYQSYFDKRAAIGVVGVLHFFMDLVTRFADVTARPFDTREEALDWLVKD